jgi:type II secretory pathway component HofQ
MKFSEKFAQLLSQNGTKTINIGKLGLSIDQAKILVEKESDVLSLEHNKKAYWIRPKSKNAKNRVIFDCTSFLN